MIDQEIQARMNAFRGNPQALMQRYSQSQQLLDLLALQKLKSEKEAAMRQMQMQAGQGQMPTVAQQREQELMGMAKQEVADRVGQVAQQQAKQQQENLQRVAQAGIAQAPAPNMMPAQAMASGGIVAFANGGETAFTRGVKSLFGIKPPTEEEAALRKRREELAAIQSEFDMGPFQGAFTLSAEDYDRRAAVRDYIQKNRRELLENPRLFAAFKANPEAFVSGGMRTAVGQITPAPAAPAAPAAPTAPTAPAAPTGGVPPEAPPPAATQMQGGLPPPGATGTGNIALPARLGAGAMPAGAPQAQGIAQAAPRATMEQRLPGAPAEIGGGKFVPGEDRPERMPMQTQPDALGLEKYLRGQMATDPAAAQAAARAEYEKDYAPLMQEQRALQQEGIAQLRERMAQQQARQDPLLAWMAGARGRTIGEVLGSAGRAGMEYQNQQAAAQAALQDQLQKLREAEMTGRIGQLDKAREAGETRRKEAMETAGKAATVAGQYSTGMASVSAREQAAEDRARQAEARALQSKALTPNDFIKVREVAMKIVDDRIQKSTDLKLGITPAKHKAMIDEVYADLLSAADPKLAAQLAAQQPAASNIPAPPPGAVRPKGAK